MNRVVIVFFFSFITSYQLNAQTLPAEGSSLCCRLIGFAFHPMAGAASYKIEIAEGNHYAESSFEKNIVTSVVSKKNTIIAEVPSFGKQYTWRVEFVSNNNVKTKSSFFHFSTKVIPNVDTAVTRLRIIENARKYKDAYVLLDGIMVMYDMKGKPVWFLHGAENSVNQQINPRDMKLSPNGAITFITGYQPYESDYYGNILWQYKPGYSNDTFHHEFTHLDNGHYMGMVSKTAFIHIPAFKDSIAHNARDSAKFFNKVNYNDLVELDANSNVVWHWSDLDYMAKSNLLTRKIVDGRRGKNQAQKTQYDGRAVDIDLHENSFYFDVKTKHIYLSFRNIDRVIKIKYPEGTVVNSYGPVYNPDGTSAKNELFCGQHSCKVSQKGYLYLYNNNTCGASKIPTIIEMQEPAPGKSELKKIWEYQCTIEDPEIAAKKDLSFISAGGVQELPDQSMFVAMSLPYSKIFIVDHDKKILWSAMPEKYNDEVRKWEPFNLYRASMITRKEMERLIWNGSMAQ